MKRDLTLGTRLALAAMRRVVLLLVCCLCSVAPGTAQLRLGGAEEPLTWSVTPSVSSEAVVLNQVPREDAPDRSFVHGLPGFEPGKRASYAGLIEADSRHGGHLFYWFFEAEHATPDTPTILWLQGGPGWSSQVGNLFEVGPFRLDPEAVELRTNPNTWNDRFNMLFIDSPFGAGFSFTGSKQGYTTSEDEVAMYLYRTLTIFYLKFPRYLDAGLVIAGESYAGKYIPSLSLYLHEQNQGRPQVHIKLLGLAIGDGFTNPGMQLSYAGYLYNLGLVTWTERDQLIELETETKHLVDTEDWMGAYDRWHDLHRAIQRMTGGINVYDVRTFHQMDTACLKCFLDRPEWRARLHVGDHTFDEVSAEAELAMRPDFMKSVQHRVEKLLPHYPVLLYNGQMDLIIATPTALEWIRSMDWSGREEFLTTKKLMWRNLGEMAGYVRKVDNLTQVTIFLAGHMVPYCQPEAAHDMMVRWIEDKPWAVDAEVDDSDIVS